MSKLRQASLLFLLTAATGGRAFAAQPEAVPHTLPYEKILPGPITEYQLLTLTNAQVSEYRLCFTPLSDQGWRFVQDRGRGGIKPWIALVNQRTGQGLALALAYGGNWKAEISARGDHTVLQVDTSPGGIPVFDHLPGNLPVPGVLVAESAGSWDDRAQPICRFIRTQLLRDLGPNWPWVQWNDYYAGGGEPTAAMELKNAPVAAALGVELFTIDGGWETSMGGWEVDRERFPQGIRPVADEVHRLGMKFGMWVEIECAPPSSRIGREHPDWFLTDGKGRRLSPRSVLDFGRPEVLACAEAVIDRMVNEFGLDYLKMDFNTDLILKGEGLSPDRDPVARHMRGLEKLRRYIRERHPRLVVENCSSGSTRQDVSAAALTDTHWVSDIAATELNSVILSQDFAASYVFPPEMNSHWLVRWASDPQIMDDTACLDAILLGQPGFSIRLTDLDSAHRDLLRARIALYKEIRPILRQADVYHLTGQPDPQAPRSFTALLYLDPKSQQGVIFAFASGSRKLSHRIRLPGLDPKAKYQIDLPSEFGGPMLKSGRELMTDGFILNFNRPGQSCIARVKKSSVVGQFD